MSILELLRWVTASLDRSGVPYMLTGSNTGFKADLIIRKSRRFSEVEFSRRQAIDVDDTRLWVASVEDVILAKLEWAKLGESGRQITDVVALLRTVGETIDLEYLMYWVEALDLGTQWQAVQG